MNSIVADHRDVYDSFMRDIEAAQVDARLMTNQHLHCCRQIKEDAKRGSRFDFLRWPSLAAFSVPDDWIPPTCYDALRHSHQWNDRWFALTRDAKVGTPKDFSRDFGTSPMLVQHAYHLLRYETATGRSLVHADAIFEFGGGYGSFCRLLMNAGFSSIYFIYDLVPVSLLQRLYLTLCGFPEVPRARIPFEPGQRGFCVLCDDHLDDAFHALSSRKWRVGFVATWSLSEAPMSVRERIFPRFHHICDRYLVAFQPAWESIDNLQYFSTFPTLRPELKWYAEDMPRAVSPPSRYLFA